MSKEGDELRDKAKQVRLKAFSANDHWQADWLEKLGLLEDMIEDICQEAVVLADAADAKGIDWDKCPRLLDNRSEYRRLVNQRDKLEAKGWLN